MELRVAAPQIEGACPPGQLAITQGAEKGQLATQVLKRAQVLLVVERERLVTRDGDMVYERVAKLAAGPWNVNGQVCLVVGATQPAEIARVRALAPMTPLLVPGIGAQGGDVNAAVAAGLDAEGRGMIINSSRAVIFAGSDENFAQASAEAARATMLAIREAKAKALAR